MTTPTAPRPVAGEAPFLRDIAATAMVLTTAAAIWFSWGAGTAPDPWPIALGVACLPAVGFGALAWWVRRRLPPGTIFDTRGKEAGRVSGIAFGLEFVAIAVGAVVLTLVGLVPLVICWAHLVMGLHWWPLAGLYKIPSLRASAVAAVIVGLGGALAWLAAGLSTGLVVGGLGGLTMLVGGLRFLQQVVVLGKRATK